MKKCSVIDCNMRHFAFTFCRKHHARFKRHGTTDSKYDKAGYTKLGGIKDPRPKARGSLAVNLINDIKYKALQRGKDWNLTHEQAFTLIKQSCVYCCFIPIWPETRVGIDRFDNHKGYQIENCVSCCSICNTAKGTMTYNEFKAWISRVYCNL